MPIKAIIMAGGEGTRLRPLTLYRPKPLAPILGKPCMWYALQLLKNHGITDVGASLWYLPNAVKEAFGEELSYYEETEPLGTAGSVLLAKEDLAQTFIILSGDGLTDCDLTAALHFHKEKGALATLVLKSMPVPLAYGVVLTDETGRITSFLEKPEWSQVFSDQVNTGIYILEKSVLDMIPADKSYDFGQDLFPKMVREGLPVYGYPMEGYWCDVGDQRAYVEAQLDLMEGKANLPLPGQRHGMALLAEGASLSDGAHVNGPVFLDGGARVESGAVLGAGTVIGEGSFVASGARLERTCLWENAAVGRGAVLRGAVLCDGSYAHQGSMMEEETALGSGAELMQGAILAPGVKIWPHRTVHRDAKVYESVVWGDLKQLAIVGGSCRVETTRDGDALCGALCDILNVKRAMVVRGEKGEALQYALIGALCSRGVQVIRFDKGTLPALRKLQAYMKVELGLFIKGDTVSITLEDGQDMDKPLRRKLETLALRQDYQKASRMDGECCAFAGAEHLYAALLAQEQPPSSQLRAAVFCGNSFVLSVCEELMAMLECLHVRVAGEGDLGLLDGEIGYLLSRDGTNVNLVTKDGVLDDMKQAQLFFRAMVETGEKALFLPKDAPQGILSLLPKGVNVFSPSERKQAPEIYRNQTAIFQDGLLKMLVLMRAYPDIAALNRGLEALPLGVRLIKDVPCPQRENGRVLRGLMNRIKDKRAGDGLWIEHDLGLAHLAPYDDRAAFRIAAEAKNMESALELCDLYAKDIETLLDREP